MWTIETPSSHLLLNHGWRVSCSSWRKRHRLLRLTHPFTPLFLETLLTARFTELNHVILSSPPPLLRIHGHLKTVAAHLHPLARPQWHLGGAFTRIKGWWIEGFLVQMTRDDTRKTLGERGRRNECEREGAKKRNPSWRERLDRRWSWSNGPWSEWLMGPEIIYTCIYSEILRVNSVYRLGKLVSSAITQKRIFELMYLDRPINFKMCAS